MQVPIRQISYTGADIKDKKMFAFVSNDQQTQAMFCHIFKTKAGVWHRTNATLPFWNIFWLHFIRLRTWLRSSRRPLQSHKSCEQILSQSNVKWQKHQKLQRLCLKSTIFLERSSRRKLSSGTGNLERFGRWLLMKRVYLKWIHSKSFIHGFYT